MSDNTNGEQYQLRRLRHFVKDRVDKIEKLMIIKESGDNKKQMINEDLQQELANAANDMVFRNIRPDIIESLHRYIFHGIEPGGFLTAVLCNDLVEAVGRADHRNIRCLKDIVSYCYMQLPMGSWRTEANYVNWLKRFKDEN